MLGRLFSRKLRVELLCYLLFVSLNLDCLILLMVLGFDFRVFSTSG